jgi:hypothetical protein
MPAFSIAHVPVVVDNKKNNMSTDMEKGRGQKRARVTRG